MILSSTTNNSTTSDDGNHIEVHKQTAINEWSIPPPKLRYLCLSDIHIGHARNPAKAIVSNLADYFSEFTNKSIFTRLDIIFIVGDLFDQLIDCSGPALYEALEFITRLVSFCGRNKIKLRILEGTPSHDRQQSRLFEFISSVKESVADVKWIKTLMVERMEDLNLSILYVPDEYTASTDITLQLVYDLFKNQGIEQVDIAMMHGAFNYQMRCIPGQHDTHNETAYLSLVKHFINVGHIHTHSNYERIIAQGSFDRLAHGEEEPKGGVLMTIRDDGSDYYEFIENKKAKIFKTIEIKSEDLQKCLHQLERILLKIPNESYIRIKAPKLHPILVHISELKKQYQFIHFSKLSLEEEEEQQSVIKNTNEFNYSVVEIRPENIVNLIIKELSPDISEFDKKRLEKILIDLPAVA